MDAAFLLPDNAAWWGGKVPYQGHQLYADVLYAGHAASAQVLCIHGGGASAGHSFHGLRQWLLQQGVGSAAVDGIGHGRTGGVWADSSLGGREQQIQAAVQHLNLRPRALVGASMGAYNAIRLAQQWGVQQLVLVVPGIYTPQALHLAFGPAFSAVIRQPGSWADSDVWDMLAAYTGRLLVVAAAHDEVIPPEIPQRLYAVASRAQHRQLLTLAGAGHKDVVPHLAAWPQALAALQVCLSWPARCSTAA